MCAPVCCLAEGKLGASQLSTTIEKKKSQDGIFKKRTRVFIYFYFFIILLIKYEMKNSPGVRVRGAFTVTLRRLSCRHSNQTSRLNLLKPAFYK